MTRPFPTPGPNDVWGQKLLDAIEDRTNVEAIEANLPDRLQEAELNATYVTFVDAVTGLPLVDKHVIIKVDQTTDEIADIVVEEI